LLLMMENGRRNERNAFWIDVKVTSVKVGEEGQQRLVVRT
jgi:hypothetical protein